MKISAIAAAVLFSLSFHPAMAQTSCSEAFALCQKPQDTGRCDIVCKTHCSKEKKACLKTGNFAAKNNKWAGLEKK
jgi:hypothetical protein